jgi:hypothetical protein
MAVTPLAPAVKLTSAHVSAPKEDGTIDAHFEAEVAVGFDRVRITGDLGNLAPSEVTLDAKWSALFGDMNDEAADLL